MGSPKEIRAKFPVLSRRFDGQTVAYLDNAASTLKPEGVIGRVDDYYRRQGTNVHRGGYRLGREATEAFEGARRKMAAFLGAESSDEIVFVRGATHGLNLLARGLEARGIGSGDRIVVSAVEHHSNLLPWQAVCRRVGAELRVIPLDAALAFDLEAADRLIDDSTRVVAFPHVSNVLGTTAPLAELVEMARSVGAWTLVDGAQAPAHRPLAVGESGVDFYVISGHKMFGPTGVGVLYGRRSELEQLPPVEFGGGMVREVSSRGMEPASLPERLEAGTPPIAQAIGLAAAAEFIEEVGRPSITRRLARLTRQLVDGLDEIDGVEVFHGGEEAGPVVSFRLDGVHPYDVQAVLDGFEIAVRAGHHCAQPLMERLGLEATVRVSLALYNTRRELERLLEAVERARALG